jgi:hypothetical protein
MLAFNTIGMGNSEFLRDSHAQGAFKSIAAITELLLWYNHSSSFVS